MKQLKAKLRVCASCEWVFLRTANTDTEGCPKCGFAHYGARFVYENKAYRYAKTQEPWIKRKMDKFYYELLKELSNASNNLMNLT
jgi:predicted  nucleic acid-binding Zn-ribbon protein